MPDEVWLQGIHGANDVVLGQEISYVVFEGVLSFVEVNWIVPEWGRRGKPNFQLNEFDLRPPIPLFMGGKLHDLLLFWVRTLQFALIFLARNMG